MRAYGVSSKRVVAYIVLTMCALIMIYPLLWLISSSLKPTNAIFTDVSLLPQHFSFSNYLHGWTALQYPFTHYFLNSFAIAAGAIAGNLISCSMAAYAFGRLRFSLKPLWFALMLTTIMLPYHVVVVPQYILFSHLGWVNTFYPLIVPKFLATDTFFVFLMVQFVRTLPRELDQAAEIDGCGFFGTYWRIILPLMTPALATTAIFTFIWTWNDFFTPLIYLDSPSNYTVPLALANFIDSQGQSSWGQLFAMSTLSLLPVFAVFLIGQRFLVRGIATTGLK